jgi:hypothetical protein
MVPFLYPALFKMSPWILRNGDMFKELIDMFDFSMILVLKFYELFSKFSTYTFTPFKST